MKPWLVFRVASHAVCVWNINQSFTPISSHQNPYTPANSQLILTTLSNNVESYQKYVMARWLLLQVKLRCRDFRLFRGFLRLWFWLFLCLLLFLFAFLFLLLLAILFLFFHVLYFLRLLFFFSFLKWMRNKYMNYSLCSIASHFRITIGTKILSKSTLQNWITYIFNAS